MNELMQIPLTDEGLVAVFNNSVAELLERFIAAYETAPPALSAAYSLLKTSMKADTTLPVNEFYQTMSNPPANSYLVSNNTKLFETPAIRKLGLESVYGDCSDDEKAYIWERLNFFYIVADLYFKPPGTREILRTLSANVAQSFDADGGEELSVAGVTALMVEQLTSPTENAVKEATQNAIDSLVQRAMKDPKLRQDLMKTAQNQAGRSSMGDVLKGITSAGAKKL